MELQRYHVVEGKNPREMVLLRAYPCRWGKCTFCDYIADNDTNTEKIVQENREILQNVTGELGVLDVIDSASCFDLPQQTVTDLLQIIQKRQIQKMFTECHYMYRKQLKQWRKLFQIPLVFRCGVETFDAVFRNEVLRKGAYFNSPKEVADYFDSVCLMVGIEGQTREMVRRDMEALETYFAYGCINIFTPNTTQIKADLELIQWFRDEYAYLEDNPQIEILWHNEDLGVGTVLDREEQI